MNKAILLGDEAVARGAIDAGISVAYAYPGTPATEIYMTIEAQVRQHGLKVRGMWSSNEKVALEQALGASYAGARVLVSMKHVGLNVAADPFMNAAITGAHGGMVIVVADDPGMHSSQNEQDSRYFADFAMLPCLEPADQQQCYDLTRLAFELSEQFQLPVLLRLVTRLAHSRAQVTAARARAQNAPNYVKDATRFTLLPSIARSAYIELIDKQTGLTAYSEEIALNALRLNGAGLPGILVSGLARNYLQEALGERLAGYNLLHIGMYPLPTGKIRQLLDASSELFVIEEGYPFIERLISAGGLLREKRIRGKLSADLPRTGELNPDAIKQCFGLPLAEALEIKGLAEVLALRPPMLCDKCPHTDSYIVIKEALAEISPEMRVMGDIGCYTLGHLAPHRAIHSCLCMGASIGMATGVTHAGMRQAICVIGDGTFTHSGMAGLLDAAKDNANVKVFILDNSVIAMTGGQPTSASQEEVVNLVAGLGVTRAHIRVIEPTSHKKSHNLEVIREELAYDGLSVIIARRICVTYSREIKDHEERKQARGEMLLPTP